MHDERNTKIAAAIAGVAEYLRAEQKGSAFQSAAPPFAPGSPINLWGLGGRRSMMRIRNLMQMRAFGQTPARTFTHTSTRTPPRTLKEGSQG